MFLPHRPQRDKSEWQPKSGNSIYPFLLIILSLEEFENLNLNETEFISCYVSISTADFGFIRQPSYSFGQPCTLYMLTQG